MIYVVSVVACHGWPCPARLGGLESSGYGCNFSPGMNAIGSQGVSPLWLTLTLFCSTLTCRIATGSGKCAGGACALQLKCSLAQFWLQKKQNWKLQIPFLKYLIPVQNVAVIAGAIEAELLESLYFIQLTHILPPCPCLFMHLLESKNATGSGSGTILCQVCPMCRECTHQADRWLTKGTTWDSNSI